MAWARMDDGFHDHPKVGRLSLAAVGLWTLCFTWCNRHLGADDLPPGYIPTHQPKRFGGTPKQIAELVASGLWEKADGGWIFHDFQDYLPAAKSPMTASEVGEARSRAGRKGAARRWQDDGKLPSALPSGNRNKSKESVKDDEVGTSTDAHTGRDLDPSKRSPRRSERYDDGKLPSDTDGKPMPPSRPVPKEGGGLDPKVRPDPWCNTHPGGTEAPCAACGRARRAHDSWQKPTPTPPTIAELRAAGVIQ